jgi:hypothetical protein
MFLIALALLSVVSLISSDLVGHVARNLEFHFHEQILFSFDLVCLGCFNGNEHHICDA